jgi:hypothetical protein
VASIIRPPATKTEGRLNSDNSNEKTAGDRSAEAAAPTVHSSAPSA